MNIQTDRWRCTECGKNRNETIEYGEDNEGVRLCLDCLNRGVMMLLEHMRRKEDERAANKIREEGNA